MPGFVSLLRGINVGGRQAVRMDELKALYESLGLKDVASYIQSGNVVFSGDSADLGRLPAQLEDAFAERFGFRVSIMVRTATELEAIVARNPFRRQVMEDPQRVVALFLAARPEGAALEVLQQAYAGPEELCLIDQELYVYYVDGIGRSKLTLSLMEKKLNTFGTARNWNTVLQLQKMLQR